MWINIHDIDLIPLVNLSVFKPILSCFNYCSSIVELGGRDGDASKSSFIIQDCLAYAEFLVFPYELENCFCELCD